MVLLFPLPISIIYRNELRSSWRGWTVFDLVNGEHSPCTKDKLPGSSPDRRFCRRPGGDISAQPIDCRLG
jgi:hypothetical protein